MILISLNVTTVTNRWERRIIGKPTHQKFWSEGLQVGFSGVYGKDTPIGYNTALTFADF